MKEYLKSLFSVGEDRVSTLVTIFIVLIPFVVYVYLKTPSHTIGSDMLNLLLALIAAIAGTNVTNGIRDSITNKNQQSQEINSNQNNIKG